MDPKTPNQSPAVSGGAQSYSAPTGGAQPYYGSFFTCTVGVSLLLTLLFFVSALLGNWMTHPEKIEISMGILGASLLFTIAFGANSYYFCISGSYLEIRNHVYPWYLKVHHLEEVEGVEFRSGSLGRPDALRVKRKDSPWSGRYHAGSLRQLNWKSFEKALQRRGIPVDNHLGT